MKATTPKSIFDLLQADHIKIIGEKSYFKVKRIDQWDNVGIYLDNEVLTGYVKNSSKKGIFNVELRRNGLNFLSEIEYKNVQCYE